MRVEPTRTIYPRLPDIMDSETLSLVTVLEPAERAFVDKAKNPRVRYLNALYLKAMAYLGHSRVKPGQLPRLFRLRLAQELGLDKEFANILKIHSVEKSRIITPIRQFLGLQRYNRTARIQCTKWLRQNITANESDLLVVVNEAIRWFGDQSIELPVFQVAVAIAQTALSDVDKKLQKQIFRLFNEQQVTRLKDVLLKKNGRTPFDRFKDPVGKASSITLQAELGRLKELSLILRGIALPQSVSRRKVDYFADIAVRSTASEINQLILSRRVAILYCYLTVRRSQLLDSAAEALIQIWRTIASKAKVHANDYRQALADTQAEYETVLQDLLEIICDNATDYDLVRQIRKYRTLAIEGALRFAPMTQHLIDRKVFLANYHKYLKKLDCSAQAADFYTPLIERLAENLARFDQNYESVYPIFQASRSGRLSYLRSSSKKPLKCIKKLTSTVKAYLTPATIMEVILDCHKLTGFLDLFRPMRRRQTMDDEQWLQAMLATLYAYGCNCGRSQASQATGVSKQSIVYFRRHYMGTQQLMQAASFLADAYTQTGLSQYLKDPGVFMTDAMHFPTLENSLGARHYFRNRSKKNVLLYQHVTADCICLFTKALLCGVSEAVHMLGGAVNQTTRYESTVNICDNAGRSDLVFGIVPFLNIEIWPRLSSRQNLKLWKGAKDWTYTNINHTIAGTIRWDLVEAGWQDRIWVLASIAEGKADPSLIAEYLRTRPKHLASRGFNELGKAYRTIYMILYGMDMNLRKIVLRYTSRRENWNQFGRKIFHGFGGLVREKDQQSQAEVFWFLTVVQNAIVLWNALALDNAIARARRDDIQIREEDLKHVLPTMVEHINFVGQFNIDINRRPPFKLVA